jgi:signal transduction histidine kinase
MLAFIWMLFRLQTRQLGHRLEWQVEARVDERTRIARELHDTLLQSFAGLLLRLRHAHTLLSKNPDEARQMLESAIDQTRQALIEGRRAVQGLRSSAVGSQEFTEAIKTLTEDLARDQIHAGVAELTLNIEGTRRPLRPLVGDELYRITGEALRNAFRHARASRVEVQLIYGNRTFELRVRDDGKGIDPELLRGESFSGHFGLRGIRERVERLGGKFTVWSAPGSGTELVLTVSGATAYGTAVSGRLAWLARIVYRNR